MRKRTVAIAALLSIVALVVTAAGGALAWLFYTPGGLAWALAQASQRMGEALEIDGVSGTLAGGATIGTLRFTGPDIELRIADAAIALSPLSVLMLEPRIAYLRAAEVAVVTKPSETPGKPPDSLVLPADFHIVEARVARLTVDMGEGPLVFTDAALAYEGGRRRHSVRDARVTAFGYAISSDATIGAEPPFALEAKVRIADPARPALGAEADLRGNLNELSVEGRVRAAEGGARFALVARPYAEVRVGSVRLDAENLDLAVLDPRLPHTRLSGNVALEEKEGRYSGPIELTNAVPGPYDKERLPLARLAARVATDLKVVGLTALDVELAGGGAISGTGRVDAGRAVLELALRRVDLRALHTKLYPTALDGKAALDATADRQKLTASLTQDAISLAFNASRAGDTVEVERLEAAARGGRARGSGRVTLAGRQPFSVELQFERFDPAAWGEFPAGSLNGYLSARGEISAQRVDATLVMRDSRLFGGTVRGRAQASGAWTAPRVAFDVEGAGLSDKTSSVKRIAARGTVELSPRGTLEVSAEAAGLTMPQVALRTLEADVRGTRAAHTARIAARGERIDFRLRAAGALRTEPALRWSGAVQELANRGEIALRLRAPVDIVAGAAEVRAQPFELDVMGGQLAVTELAYVERRLRTSGRMTDLPVEPLLALAAPGAPVKGTLRLDGTWNVSNTPAWNGVVSVRRRAGDLAMTGERPLALGLQTLAVDANISERAASFEARVESALARVEAKGRALPTSAGYGAASPLEMTVAADVARLAPLAAFVDTPMIIDGQVQARLTGRGTLADPRLTGPITARGLTVAMPAEGVSLSDGTLDAVLEAKEIRVKRFALRGGAGTFTAQGTLARTAFETASLDWKAERFTALARPDRKLVVTGSGNAALEKKRLSLKGRLSADEGEFALGGTTLPTLGSDVVIVGRAPKPKPDTAPEPARSAPAVALDLTIALGNRVHVSGQGLDVWLSGDVHVYTNARGEILAKGTVNARNGTFAAYGQRLDIDRGFFYFNGPVANPALDILAVRRRLAVQPGVAVTGTLKNPLVRVVSDPPLPQGEALSWLVLGRGPDQAGTGELSALPLAASALTGKATGSIARALSLDELGLRSGAASEQFVTVGKRISDRIYVAFEQGVGNAESLLRLEMTVTRRVLLRLQAGTTSLFGVFYRYRWD